jgi:polyribonucleotide nucleotidyltransferase
MVAMVAASAALTLSGVPFMGPIGGARVGYINGEYVLNPHVDEMEESSLDLVVAGTTDAVLMVESEAKELAEDVMLGAVMFGHKSFQPVIDAIIKLAEAAPRSRATSSRKIIPSCEAEMLGHVAKICASLQDHRQGRALRQPSMPRPKVKEHFAPAEGEDPASRPKHRRPVFKSLQAKVVRGNILEDQEPHRRP